MSATCPLCGCDQGEGLLCHADTSRLEKELGDVAAIIADLDITLSKQARIGASSGGAGLARERMPIGLGAMQAADNLGNVLTTWARDVIAADYSPGIARPPHAAAFALLAHINEIRRHAAVVELVDEISDAIKQARRVIDRPADRVYLGQCYAETPDDDGRQVTCLAELYARPEARDARCQVCRHEHPVAERRAWLMQQAADMIVTVKEASTYLGTVGGIKVSQASIRGYLHRGRLAYRPGVTNGIRLGDLLTVVLDDSEKKGTTRTATGNLVA